MYTGVSNVTLPDGTTLVPYFEASFVLSVPELEIDSIAARITTIQVSAASLNIQVRLADGVISA